MAEIKISFEHFYDATDKDNRKFVLELHDYMLNNGCKGTFEEKKTGLLASYKHNKKSVINVLLKSRGLIVRIYGEHLAGYRDFLNTLPEEMVKSIQKASKCKRLVFNTCSPKCTGYDFIINDEHFQNCRYNCFEFLVTDNSALFIKAFIDNEIKERKIA